MIDREFWRGKKVFVTGHTGFKGSWLSLWLSELGAEVKGYALEPNTEPSLFNEANIAQRIQSEFGDIQDFNALKASIDSFAPEIVIHMAAQPLVRYSYDAPLETYSVNVMGTANLLEAVRTDSVRATVVVTTDKCYENREWLWGYRENDRLGGYDPYSNSKACAELVVSAYRNSFMSHTGLASARAGNVIGGGDWAKDRLIPDILMAFQNSDPVMIRNPHAIRPWQHVLEPLAGYMVLAEKLYNAPSQYSEAWNFGPHDQDVKEVSWILDRMVESWQDASWELDEAPGVHEATYLKLDISKSIDGLQWQPTWSLEQALKKIVEWHTSWMKGHSANDLCIQQIKEYMEESNL